MKKQILLILVSVLFTINLYSQIDSVFSKKSLDEKISIVKDELISDTSKFDEKDLYRSTIGTQNSKNYGILFFINGKQLFKPDIVDKYCIEDFIENYLEESNIESIERINQDLSTVIFGINGKNGVVLIELKKLKKAKTTQCNFELGRKLEGNNFNQSNSFMIRD
ncbi:MAG: hypothetical protein AB8G11_16095 [Saprospiraceae bacterium]